MIRVLAFIIFAVFTCSTVAVGADGLPVISSRPEISANPNPRVPLAAILRFTVDRRVQTVVTVSDGERRWNIRFPFSADPSKGLPILGLRPNTRHQFHVMVEDEKGRQTRQDIGPVFITPSLPLDGREWPTLRLVTSQPSLMEPGITLLSVRRRTFGRGFRLTESERRFTEDWGLILGIDNQGEVVWYYRSDDRISGVDRLRNGNILFHLDDFRTREIDMLGNTVREFYAELRPWGTAPGAIPIKGIQTLHHQPKEMPNGNYLAFSANARVIENYYTSETDLAAPRTTQKVIGDTVVQFNQHGEIVWSWNAFEHLDVFRIGYDLTDPYWYPRGFPGHLDWTHGNGIDYDPRDDSVIFYLKHQDASFKVDRKSGQIKWIFGEPSDWPENLRDRVLRPIGDLRWPFHAHNPRLTNAGTYVMYDNGHWGARPFTGKAPLTPNEAFSRGVEFEIDEIAMTVREVWSSHRNKSSDSCHSNGMGDAHRLSQTGNILVIDPVCWDQDSEVLTYRQRDFTKRHTSELYHSPRVREYRRHEKGTDVVWEVRLTDPHQILNWQVYGGLRVPALYPVGAIQASSTQ